MPEMPDVVTLTTISSDWGNDIRDRTIQRYSSVSNRTTEHPTPAEGDLSYLEDSNTVWVYNGAAWVNVAAPVQTADLDPSVLVDPVRAGGAQNATSGALTTSLVDKASVVFTKPTGWTTYALIAWGSVMGHSSGGGSNLLARVEIGAANGGTVTAISSGFEPMTVPVFHSVTAQTASPVTVAVAAAEGVGETVYDASTIAYTAYRLT